MPDTLDLAGVTYTTRVVTLNEISLDDLLAAGKLDQRIILYRSIVRADGQAIDWSTVPIGHAMRLLPMALAAAGFDTVGATTGNV